MLKDFFPKEVIWTMLNLKKVIIDYCMEELRKAYHRTYTDMESQFGNITVWSGHLALENIANTDALYHDVEHTLMVTLAGQAILEGKHLSEGGVTPGDWMHFMIALLCHDIGYVKGICQADEGNVFATGVADAKVELSPEATDAALAMYHVDRSKMFVRERFGKNLLWGMASVIDAELIGSYIEMTRFPVPKDDWYKDTKSYRGLVRAADLIGQLGDPNRLQKCPALFYEFEEIGLNKKIGYNTPGDLRLSNARFYWDVVSPYVQEALRYLRVTQEGKEWVASLHANVLGAQHRCSTWPYTCSPPERL
jgi:hypothetical protein